MLWPLALQFVTVVVLGTLLFMFLSMLLWFCFAAKRVIRQMRLQVSTSVCRSVHARHSVTFPSQSGGASLMTWAFKERQIASTSQHVSYVTSVCQSRYYLPLNQVFLPLLAFWLCVHFSVDICVSASVLSSGQQHISARRNAKKNTSEIIPSCCVNDRTRNCLEVYFSTSNAFPVSHVLRWLLREYFWIQKNRQ